MGSQKQRMATDIRQGEGMPTLKREGGRKSSGFRPMSLVSFGSLVQAKKHLQALFAELSGDERDALLKNSKSSKAPKSKEYAMETHRTDTHRTDQQPTQLSIPDKNGEVCTVGLKFSAK